jgi:hypothetical protein
MGTGYKMCDANALKKGVEGLIFTPSIGLHSSIFSIKLVFNRILEITKALKHLRFVA